ncbi:MAG: hypothetical protein V2A79_03110 [Planctomycetota bacterium]
MASYYLRSKKRNVPFCLSAILFLLGGMGATGAAPHGLKPAAQTAQADTPTHTLDCPVVFTQLPPQRGAEQEPGRGNGTLRCDYGSGGRIARLDPDGRFRVLTEGLHSACGADVSFDGQRILFAGKRAAQDAWTIWEMNADGSEVRQITHDSGNCRCPIYLTTLYTLDDVPQYQIAFVSDATGQSNEAGCGLATSLYRCKLDGSAIRRLTLNPSDDLDPFPMEDGRVLLASWQRMDLRRGVGGRVALFGVNVDGTDYALFCGAQGRRIKHMPCVTPNGLVVFVEADQVGWDGAGQLAAVTLRRNLHSYRPITQDEHLLYHSPAPLPDGTVLVSARRAGVPSSKFEAQGSKFEVQGSKFQVERGGAQLGSGGSASGTHGVYRLDPQSGQAELIFDDPRWHDIHARAVVSRPEPDGRSSVVNEASPTGKLYCLNAYLTDPAVMSYVEPGMIRGLRVLEGVSEPSNEAMRSEGTEAHGLKPAALVPRAQRRLLGQVPVEEDGSFQIEVPADVPIQLQTLDAEGMALNTCGWIWVKRREWRGCIGCHEDPELAPENRLVLAVQHPAMKLTLPAEKRRTVDFRRDVMPILVKKCVACHVGNGGGLDLRAEREGDFNRAYQSLLVGISALSEDRSLTVAVQKAESDPPAVGKYVHPGEARTSPLIWRLFGRNTSRPWDEGYRPGQTSPPCPPPEAEALTNDERMTFVEWIDLGALWDGIPGPDEFPQQADGGVRGETRR